MTMLTKVTGNTFSASPGETLRLSVYFSDAVSLSLAASGAQPFIPLSNGATAFVNMVATANAPDNVLIFDYLVSESDTAQAALFINGIDLNGALLVSGAQTTTAGAAVDVTITPGQNNAVMYMADAAAQPESVSIEIDTDVTLDLVAPQVTGLDMPSGRYVSGDTLVLQVRFSEPVGLVLGEGFPSLVLRDSNGVVLPEIVARYSGGSGTKTLSFSLTVNDAMSVDSVFASHIDLHGSQLTDTAGNAVSSTADAIDISTWMLASTEVNLGAQVVDSEPVASVPTKILRIAYMGDDSDVFGVGERLVLDVVFDQALQLDTTSGQPRLVLDNGGVAEYVGRHPEQDNVLQFAYVVQAGQRNTADLGVLGLALNNAQISDTDGLAADVRIQPVGDNSNNLNAFNDIHINAQSPYVTRLDGDAGLYGVGDTVLLRVHFNEAVEVSGGQLSLSLNNNGQAQYVSGNGTDTFVFAYEVADSEVSIAQLSIASLSLSDGQVDSLQGYGQASLSLSGATDLLSTTPVTIDTLRPEAQIEIADTVLISGQSTLVTLHFSEAVSDPNVATSVSGGELSRLVSLDEGVTWQGMFTPANGLDTQVSVRVDNRQIFDAAGNTGGYESVSQPIVIDSLGPQWHVSETLLANGQREVTVDFIEPVSDFDISELRLSNGELVSGSVQTVTPGQVYRFHIAPLAQGAVGEFGLGLNRAAVQDSVGNDNAALSYAFNWDTQAPRIVDIQAQAGVYSEGDTVLLRVRYDEVVVVDSQLGVPFLALSNGDAAQYVSGSESRELVFSYPVTNGTYNDALAVLALVEDSGVIRDVSGNVSLNQLPEGQSQVTVTDGDSLLVDAQAPQILTMQADDGLYVAGDELVITVRFSEAVQVTSVTGLPILALSNGATAAYVDTGSQASHSLQFVYTVAENDFDSSDLDVLALLPNGALLTDDAGNAADLVLDSELNHLAYRSDVVIDAATPYLQTLSTTPGHYQVGEQIDIVLGWNKPVVLDTRLGEPELLLSNGQLVSLNSAASNATRLVFSYTVSEHDSAQSGGEALSVVSYRNNDAQIKGVVAGVAPAFASDAVLAAAILPEDGQLSSASGGVYIDTQGVSTATLSVTNAQGEASLQAGEVGTVTLVFNEAVQGVSAQDVIYSHGELGAFSSDDNITWQATYIPEKEVELSQLQMQLSLDKVRDLAGNPGVSDVVVQGAYVLDTAYPTVTLRTDVSGVTSEPVRVVVNFSQALADEFSLADVDVSGGSVDTLSLETPDNSGRPAGEYSFIVTPTPNSTQPIKVRVLDAVVHDTQGNPNKPSGLLVQPVDTVAAKIEAIESPAGTYAVGERIELKVRFSEDTYLHDAPDATSTGHVPTLFLNNGAQATYVSGAGSDVWVFEYTYSAADTSARALQVLSFLENDKLVLDGAGNASDTRLHDDNRLQQSILVDSDKPVVNGFSAIESAYNSTAAAEDGVYKTGDVVWLKMHLSEWVHVDSTQGRPSLVLANGGQAQYVSGHGSDTLLFRYVVQDDDAATLALQVAQVALNGGIIQDAAGNLLDNSDLLTPQVQGEAKASGAVVIDTQAAQVQQVSLVESVAQDTAQGADENAVNTVNNGYYQAGKTMAFEVQFDDIVEVDISAGSPELALSNGQIASYIQGSGTDTLRFEYTVSEDDINTDDLHVLGLAEQGAVITDKAGNPALVEMVSDKRNYDIAVVDTQAPKLTATEDSFSENERGDDLVRSLETVTFSFTFDGMMDLILAGDTSLDPRDTDAIDALVAAKQDEILALFNLALEPLAGSELLRIGLDDGGTEIELIGADQTADIVKSNFRFATDQEGNLDLTTFSIDVEVPDRTYADLVVSLDATQMGDFAQNIDSAANFSHRQAVDTQGVTIKTTPTAGLFIGSQSTVRALDINGDELGTSVTLDPNTGRASIDILPSEAYPGGYRGPVIVEVIDNDSNPDYIDEYTGDPVTLSDGTTAFVMRAMFNVTEPGDVSVTVSPVTELAVTKLTESMSVGEALDAAKVEQYNAGIGKIFGLNDIVTTAVTVVNSARVESATGVDVADFDTADGIDASEKYGQVLAMLSAQDAVSGSLSATVAELAAQIQAVDRAGQTTLAIKQAGADKLAAALDSSAIASELSGTGVDRTLLDVAYIEDAAAAGFGLNLAEAENTAVPVKATDAAIGDRVFVQWGVIHTPSEGETVGDPNLFSVVITAETPIDASGNYLIAVPLEVIQKQGDATDVAVSTAVVAADAVDAQGNPKTEPEASDFSAPVLLAVDIIPPETSVLAPNAEAPLTLAGDVTGIRGGDDLNILLNNSADERFKYELSTAFLDTYLEKIESGSDAVTALQAVNAENVLPAGLSVSTINYNSADGTFSFDWTLDLTQAISVAEEAKVAAADAAGESYTPVPTFVANDEKSVFQVQASTADLVGNADADDARNEVIIGSVDDLVESPAEQAMMDQALNRLSARYGDGAVDTRAEILTLANAIDNINSLTNGDVATATADLTRASQTLELGSSGTGAVAAGIHQLVIGDQSYTIDLSATVSPTVTDIVADLQGWLGYAELPYTLSAQGDSVAINWKSFGPQPTAEATITTTSTENATQITAAITSAGSLADFAVQTIALQGTTDAESGQFIPATGSVDLAFDGVALSTVVAEGDSVEDILASLKADAGYASLPFTLAVNASGNGFTATWSEIQSNPVTEAITVYRAFEVTTTEEISAGIVQAGAAGITTAELKALDIQNVDDSDLAAINRAIAMDGAAVSAPVVSFADTTMNAGESTIATLTFSTRVGQVPDDVLALVGGQFTTEGTEGAPIWSSTDGLTWTANFTASSALPNTSLLYAEQFDEDGNLIVDALGNPLLEVVVSDATTTPVTYASTADQLSQVALVEALVNRVTDASDTVKAFAAEQGDTPAVLPTVQDFADMAVEGVRDDNLSAVQNALATVRDRFEGEGDLFTQIETVVDSYNAVFDTVYAETEQPTPVDLIEDLNNIGVSNLSSDAARAEDQTTLLQGALQAVAVAKIEITNDDGSVITAAQQQAEMIDSVAKLESFVTSVEKVLARANGETAEVDGTSAPVAVSDSDFTTLGFGHLLQDDSTNSRLSALQKVLLDQSEGEGSDAIVNYTDLKAVLETASDAFDAIVGLTAVAQDTAYADDASRDTAIADALAQVDADSFQNMGIDGVTDVAIGAMTANQMALAVKDALTYTGNDIDSLEAIQTIVDSYSDILATAQDDAGTIEVADLTNIGVTLTAGTEDAVAELVSGVIATFDTSDVASVSDVQAKVDAIDSVFANTLRTSDTDDTNTTVVTKDELHTLGFVGATDDNLDAIQRVLSDQTDESDVKSYADLKQLIDHAVTAHADILAAATSDDLTGIDTSDYLNMGIDGVDGDLSDGDTSNDGNLAAVNDALINTGNTLDTAASVQEVVDSYNTILETATDDSGTIASADLTDIGVVLQSGTEDAVAELASGVIASLGYSDVDTVAETQAIVDAIDAVFANTLRTSDDDTTNTTVVSKDQLHTLGFSGVTDDNLDAVQRVLSDQTDESDVKSYAELKALVDAAIAAHSDILNAASTDDLTDIDEADYASMGIDRVDSTNLSSINDALINTGNTLDTAASVQEVVDSYNHILDLRAGTTLALDAADFTDLGVTLKAAGTEHDKQLAYLQEIVEASVGDGDITTVSGLQALADATSDLIDLIQGTSPDSDGVSGLTVAQWALLGVTAADAEEAAMFSARLALTADDLSEVGDLATDLAARVQESRDSLAKIKLYAESDASGDFDSSGTFDAADIPTVTDFENIGVTDYVVQESVAHALTISNGSLIVDGNEASNLPSAITTTSGKSVTLVEAVMSNGEQYYYFNVDNTSGFSYDEDRLNWTEIDEVFAGAAAQGAQLVLPAEGLGNIDVVLDDLDAVSGLATGGDQWNWYATATDRKSSTHFGGDSGADTPSVVLVKVQSTPLPAPDTRVGGTYEYDLSDVSLNGELISITADGTALTNGVTIQGTPGTAGSKLVFTPTSDLDLNRTFKFVASSGLEIPINVQGAVPIDTTNIASINELFAASDVGADAGDDPATTRTEVQYVIDQNVAKLEAIAKIVTYAEANVATPADASLIPDAADFTAAGVTGVADDNNVAALLTKLAALGTNSNGLAVDTVPELQAFVKQVAIEKIQAWTDTDGGNGAAPILQDYLNANLVSYDDSVITEAMIPALNELFAGSFTSAGDADNQTEQQAVIDGAANMLAAMAKIANYAQADGAIDLDGDVATGDANGYDQLTVADFEAAGISGVADGTVLSAGTGTSVAANGYNNLDAVLNKLADSGIKYLNADTLAEVQALVAEVAVEKIAYYADQDGQWPAVSESYALYTDDATGGGTAFFINGVGEAPTLDLKPGTYTFDLSQSSMAGTALTFSNNADGTGGLPTGVTFVTTGTAGQAGASAVLTVPQGYEGTLHYSDANTVASGGKAVAESLYFAPEVQDYTNAGLVDPNDAPITANHLPFVNAIFANATVGDVTEDAVNNLFDADDATSQQAAIDAYGASLLSLMKFVDYMLSENAVVKTDFTLADFTNAGLVRVTDDSTMSGVLDQLPKYENLDTLDRDALDSVDKIQAFISRAIIADYELDPANHQAPVGADYVAAGIAGADDDNAAAMNYQVGTNANYADNITALEALVAPANAAIIKLATDNLDHIEPITTDSSVTVAGLSAYTFTTADFGDYTDAAGDALASVVIKTLPSSGVLSLDGSAVTAGDSVSVADISTGILTYTAADTTSPADFTFSVVDANTNESAIQNLAIDRTDFSLATAIANSGLVQADEGVWSNVYIGDALTGYDALSSVRVVISASQGDVRFSSISGTGVTEIETGFDRATNGGDEIAIEGTQAQVNAAFKLLQTKITAGQDKVDISIDVQPGGAVYNPENGHFYKVYTEGNKTWSAAKADAEGKTFEGMQGYLVTITSAEENAFISSKVAADSWLGGSDEAEDGVWRWVTGPEGENNSGAGTIFYLDPDTETVPSDGQPGYDNFDSGEPNGHNGGESYSQMYVNSGRWNDLSGTATQSAYVVEFGGLSTDLPSVKSGVRTLTVYATEALANAAMTIADFAQAGVSGVTADNVAAINQVLSTKSSSDTDTNPKLQAIVDATIAAIAKVEDYNNVANSVTSLDETDYAAAGIVGVAAANLAAVNADVLAKSTGGADTHAEIQAIVSQNVIEAYAESTDGSGLTAPSVADYHALGIYAVDSQNLNAINSFVLDAATGLADDSAEIALLVQEAIEKQPLIDAVAKIKAYAESDGSSATPTLEDYVDAQISGVNEYNVGMANELFAVATVGSDAGDTLPAATQAEQQAVIDASSARLAAYAKIVSYAENNAGPVPADTDYAAIGITGLPADYVAKVNAELLTAPVDRAAVDEFTELEALISRIKITEYANNNGMTVADVDIAMTGDYVPTKEDYANVGVTEIWDGTALVAIDDTNVEQLNDLMAMRYVGDPDTNGDLTVDGSDNGRIDVINNASDAATNETNLTYAGTVNTVTEIQDAVANAMGDVGGTIGTRVEALNTISLFADAVSGLTDKAAYDAFLADTNNANLIPTSADYNAAGVLDLSDNTGGITDALVAAINYKLFEGGASLTDNTVGELQPYVDSANKIVNKIQNWAEPDWSAVAESEDAFIKFKPEFNNGDFSEGTGSTIPGWVSYNGSVDLGTTQLAGWTSPVDPTRPFNGSTYANEYINWDTSKASVSLVTDSDASKGTVLEVENVSLNGSGTWGGTNAVMRGPAVYSEEPVFLSAGAKVSVDWKASGSGDLPSVFGYLVNVDDGTTITLVDYDAWTERSQGTNFVSAWRNSEIIIPNDKAGEYKFVFVNGSNNGDNGSAAGSEFWIDNLTVEGSIPPEINGFISSNSLLNPYYELQSILDGSTYADSPTSFKFTSDSPASSESPVYFGWYNQGDSDVNPAIPTKLKLYPSNDGSDASKIPSVFEVKGWDSDLQKWVLIKSFDESGTDPNSLLDAGAFVFDMSDVDQRAYSGFMIEATSTFGGDRTVEIMELDLIAKKVLVSSLPDGSEPTFDEYNAIGFPEVTAANVADINALVFAKESAADLATLPQIKSVIDNYLAAMTRIESFANGDGSADTDGDFTADSGETGVPTVADYQAIGVRYVVNGDGLNIPISASNIAAINEVIAQTSYGDDSGDTTITTAAELRTVLNSDAVAARLTAIDKISTLATASASSITLSATGFDVESSTNDIVNLDLVGPYGTETLSATYSTEVNLTGLLAASLTSDSAYTIQVDDSGNTVISRADGQAFSVVVNSGSVGTWTLTDSNSATLSNAGDSIAVAATTGSITVADFAAAGLSDVDASVIEEAVQRITSESSVRNVDTQAELQVLGDFTPPQIASVSVQNGAFKVGDTVQVVITALNNEAGLTLDTALFNGRALTNIIDNGDGTYTGTYTVVAGDADVLANNAVTTSLGFTDPAGNQGPLETTVTLSAGTDIEPAAYALRTFDNYLNPPPANTVDLGSFGTLILPVTVDNGRVFYLLDADADGDTDKMSFTTAKLFNEDINGNVNPSPESGPNKTYRYATIGGVRLAIADKGSDTDGTSSSSLSINISNINTAVSGNEDNANYDGGLYSILDAYDGIPTEWQAAGFVADYRVADQYSAGQWLTLTSSAPISTGAIFNGAGTWNDYEGGKKFVVIEAVEPNKVVSNVAIPLGGTYEALGINDYYDGTNYFDLTSELTALANEIVASISGSLSANAIQAALDIASDKLTGMQKVLDYVADQNNPVPTAADYNAIDLGRTVSDNEASSLNANAVSAGASAVDTSVELASLLPIPSITIDSISDDTSDQPPVRDLTLTLNSGQTQDRIFALSDLQVGDYITLTLNGVTLVTENPVTDLSQSAVYNLIRTGSSTGATETTEYSNWPGVVYNHSTDSLLIRADSGVDVASLVVQAGGNATPDFITSDDDGLTIAATLSTALAEGQRLELRTDSGSGWTDITSSVTGTAVSYDSSLATTATVEMRVVNAADTAGTVASQLITIDTTASVSISSPAITNDATPLIQGTADNGSTIILSVGGATYTTAASDADGSWSVELGVDSPTTGTLTLNTNSTNAVSVTATDVAGNTSAATTQSLLIDTISPAIIDSGVVQLDAFGARDSGGSYNPNVATGTFSDGSYVVAWVTQKDTSYTVAAQRFNDDGTKNGSIINLKTDVTSISNTDLQLIATKSTGEFVVSWSEYEKKVVQPVGADDSLATRTEIPIRGFGGNQSLATVTDSGHLVLIYEDYTQQNTLFTTRVSAQLFTVDGATVGSPVVIGEHQFSTGTSQPGAVDAKVVLLNAASGLFGVSWVLEDSSDEDYSSVYWDTFSTDGSTITPTSASAVEIKTLSPDRDYDLDPTAIALGSSGSAALVWSAIDTDGDTSIYVQKIEADHSLTATQVKLEGTGVTNGIDETPAIAAVGDSGEFVVVWSGVDSDGDSSVFVQRFDADGTVGSNAPIKLEGSKTSSGSDFDVSILEVKANGEFVVSWVGKDTSSAAAETSIYLQRFNANGSLNGATTVLDAVQTSDGGTSSKEVGAFIASVGHVGEYIVGFGENLNDADLFLQQYNASGVAISVSPSFSFGELLSASEIAADGTLTVPLSGANDGDLVTLTLNSKSYTATVSGSSASITIPFTDLDALPGGVNSYDIDVADSAGNAGTSYTGSFTKSVAGFAGIDADADGSGVLEITNTNTVARTSGSADSTAKVALDVSKASAGDTVELYVDGTLVWSDTLDAGEISSGTLVADNGSGDAINFDNYDSTVAGSGVNVSADIVTLELKLKNSGGYVQEAEDVTWDYQW